MLNRAVTVACLVTSTALFAPPALADTQPSGGVECPPDYQNGWTGACVISVEDPGGGGGGGSGGGDGGGSGGSDGGVSTCTVGGITGFYAGLADPQPRPGDPVWQGHQPGDGAIYICERPPTAGRGGGSTAPLPMLYWAAAPPDAPPPPDPEDLARQAIARMNLSAIDIGIVPEDVPGRVGLVGMPAYMWAENPDATTIGPITRSASAAGYTVTATARVDRIVWDMGDGTTVTCDGPGTPYEDRFGREPSPDCGHTYTRQSPPGGYQVSATSYWTVAWQGIGETGVIPLDFVNSTTIVVGEAQVIAH